jgi:hypothetical protein
VIVTVGGLNQFHGDFSPLVLKHTAANSICGYLTLANIRILRRAAETVVIHPGEALSHADVAHLVASVRDEKAVLEEVDREMGRIASSRSEYVASHIESFGGNVDGPAAKSYLKAWVANYELSDALSEMVREEEWGEEESTEGIGPPSIMFVRHNQFPEISSATHEEAVRIARDETRFGGRLVGRPNTALVDFQPTDSVFIVEKFKKSKVLGEKAEGTLQTPEEWARDEFPDLSPPRAPLGAESAVEDDRSRPSVCPSRAQCPIRIFAVDVNGHFEAAFSFIGPLGNTLVVVNTTTSDYTTHCPIVTWLFDLVFPPTEATALPCTLSTSQSYDGAAIALEAMGFDAGSVRSALLATKGNADAAIALLL